ncbi:hypothetical protein NML43_17830 [Rhodopseudomonas palustris]|jgi:hypothetical protein|uniref:hypothetical protein n=1 Tax=Rhodopseudomonas palustris TaxID=1076 RepID=UPI0020CC95ED|nr:hypothetical protein [Rhodopseudomonas palustris]MCP9628959.1 hypothetical protein [Rhodopseudomonas palustris]
MVHRHSKTYLFQVQRNGFAYDCSFFLTDNRLITVQAVGRRHTEALGSSPPGASAIRIAGHLIAESQPRHDEERGKGWLERLFMRSEPVERDETFRRPS